MIQYNKLLCKGVTFDRLHTNLLNIGITKVAFCGVTFSVN